MTAQRGKDLLLKIDAAGNGNFAAIAGLRSRQLAFNSETVDVTDSESTGRWRELLAGAGARRASISGSGIFKDAQSDDDLRTRFFDGTLAALQIVVPDFGTLEGDFQIVSLEYSGEHNGELTFDIALESSGAISFAAE